MEFDNKMSGCQRVEMSNSQNVKESKAYEYYLYAFDSLTFRLLGS